MSPQFVDFNGDGHLDIVAGTFDGSPHVSLGSEKGFQEPGHILDADGKRILFNMFWDYDKKEWVYQDPNDHQQCTSAFAYDWDEDGDYDLVLGDYSGGRVFVNRNRGTNAEPKFSATSEPVTVDGKPIRFPEKLATPRMVDWDGDGRLDLLLGTMGETYGTAQGGAVWFFRNKSQKGEPAFEPGVKLVGSSEARIGEPVGPGGGFYFDATDYDGDGDLDLLVGAKTTFLPEPRELTEIERARAEELSKVLKEVQNERSKIYSEASKAAMDEEGELNSDRYQAEIAKHRSQLDEYTRRYAAARKEHDALVPQRTTKNTVWLFRNVTVQGTSTSNAARF
ncbi:MAG: VCBS repeat-containing protein [Planctomycetes bacterium]|nr:VCBS repeat-containing protein [Planctomycetota bacterium]